MMAAASDSEADQDSIGPLPGGKKGKNAGDHEGRHGEIGNPHVDEIGWKMIKPRGHIWARGPLCNH